MHNAHTRTYAAAQAREHVSEILTKAERGEGVFIERRGGCFRVEVVREAPARSALAKKVLEIVDAAVEDGQWSFDSAGNFNQVICRHETPSQPDHTSLTASTADTTSS